MRIVTKVICALLISVLLISTTSFVFASDVNTDDYDPSKAPLSQDDNDKVGEIVGNILAYLRTFGAIISVVVASIIGLKYILGSVDEKANYKENAIPYVVGIVLLVSATVLPSVIWDLVH